MKYLVVLLAVIFVAGCATHQDWEPKPTFVMTGEFDGEIVMHDPNMRPPEHPGWRVADSLVTTLGVVALPYLLLREGARTVQPAPDPVIVEQPAPTIVRPEIVRP